MKRLLNALYILDETTWLTLDGENIVCTCDGREKFRLPFPISRKSIAFVIRAVHRH